MRGRVLSATAELYNGLYLSKHGIFLQSGLGTEWSEGILGYLENVSWQKEYTHMRKNGLFTRMSTGKILCGD